MIAARSCGVLQCPSARLVRRNDMAIQKKLTLSTRDRKIAGVCGGLGEYLGVDPTLIRVIWVLFALFVGSGVLAYIIAWILMPSRPETY